MLDAQLAAAIAEMPVAATYAPADGSATLSFDVSSADDQMVQLFAATNVLLDVKRLVQAQISSFASKATAETLLGRLITVGGASYRIVDVRAGADQVSYHLALSSTLK